ncbi:zinc finger protein 606 isoform X7 [Echinops telfairi]|uniref:Zinc finger protein 606 isoform X7 n=1 Tax=Echinops telfairi TaxID=9371 RepID=A0AC55D912_ECHTE|nr:zinc finger protein 606 isoform X7 [Echinops telfairi]
MAAINPWTSWGALTDQYWGMAAISPWASCVPITCHGVVSSGSDLPPPRVRAWKPALCPRDPVWPMEGTPEEARRTTWLPTDQIQMNIKKNCQEAEAKIGQRIRRRDCSWVTPG